MSHKLVLRLADRGLLVSPLAKELALCVCVPCIPKVSHDHLFVKALRIMPPTQGCVGRQGRVGREDNQAQVGRRSIHVTCGQARGP